MKKITTVLATLIVILTILCPINFVNAVNEENTNQTEEYSEAYKRYLELSDEEKAKVKVIPRKYNVPLDMIYEDTESVKEKASFGNLFGLLAGSELESTYAEELPSRFNLADKINIAIEHQRDEGNCWTFPAIKSLETYLALNGYGEYDFSEKHLAYLESEEFEETLGDSKLFEGGFFEYFEDYVMKSCGPVLEEEVPYSKNYSAEEYEYLVSLEPKAYVNETINFPAINKMYNVYSEEELKLFREKVKKHIMGNGALYADIKAPEDKWYNNNTYAECFKQEFNKEEIVGFDFTMPNHAVTIIGWDDNYSKENFNKEWRPSEDGAYIVLNSWGNSFGDNGIFYISYEDDLVESALSGIVSASINKEDILKDDISRKTIQFKDKNLYDAIKANIKGLYKYDDKNMTLKLSEQKINSINELNLSNKEIVDLTGLENFENLGSLSLENNKISNIEQLSKLKNLDLVDLSNNPIKENLKELENINLSSVYLNNCNLKDSDIDFFKNMKCSSLELQNNDLKNVENLADSGETIEFLDLSGNPNINISTIPPSEYLSLKECNVTSLDGLKVPEDGIWSLDLSGNKDIEISTIPRVGYLYLENITIDEENLDLLLEIQPDLTGLDLSYTGVTNISKINTLQNLSTLYLSGNGITSVEEFKQFESLRELYLDHNSIETYNDILYLNHPIIVDLSYNKIKEFADLTEPIYNDEGKSILEGKWFILDNNNINISNYYELPEYVGSIKNQTINMNMDIIPQKENRFRGNIEIVADEYNGGYNGVDIQLENCKIDYTNRELIISGNNLPKTAKINIKGGKLDGCNFTINLVPTTDIQPSYLEIDGGTREYIVGDDLDPKELNVTAIYPNGSFEYVDNYEFLNGKKLKKDEPLIIKYGGVTEELWVGVYDESEIASISFDNMDLYKEIQRNLQDIIIKSDDTTKTIYISNDMLDNGEHYINLNYENIQTLVGLSKLLRIRDITLEGNFEDISELTKLNNLQSVTIKNNNKVSNIEELTKCKSIIALNLINTEIPTLKSIYENKEFYELGIQKTIIEKDLEEKNGKIVLPEYMKYLKDKGYTITSNTYYIDRDEKYVRSTGEKCKISQEGKDLTLELDKELTDTKKGTNRCVIIDIAGEKINPSFKSYLKITYTTNSSSQENDDSENKNQNQSNNNTTKEDNTGSKNQTNNNTNNEANNQDQKQNNINTNSENKENDNTQNNQNINSINNKENQISNIKNTNKTSNATTEKQNSLNKLPKLGGKARFSIIFLIATLIVITLLVILKFKKRDF